MLLNADWKIARIGKINKVHVPAAVRDAVSLSVSLFSEFGRHSQSKQIKITKERTNECAVILDFEKRQIQ